jgi:hypothetical protein
MLTMSTDLDIESVTYLRSDLKRKSGVPMKIQMDTRVKVKHGGLRSKKVRKSNKRSSIFFWFDLGWVGLGCWEL